MLILNLNKTNINMDKNGTLVKKIDILLIARRVRFLGIAIIVGIVLIYSFGLFVSYNYVNKDLWQFNYLSLFIVAMFCFPSFYIKKMMLNKINSKNFVTAYFSAHVIPFAMCDLGGLFCVTTNLFVNQNIIFASTGLIVAVLFLIVNFPRFNDYDELNLDH